MNAHPDHWSDLHAAALVAQHGTVSAAAKALGLHHATLLRRIARLEARLGTRLFHRTPRGYTPTEAGRRLARIATAAGEQFDTFASGLTREAGLSGQFTVTTFPELAVPLASILAGIQLRHPGLSLSLMCAHRLLKLEYGEAHISVRVGPRPSEPDNVVQPLAEVGVGLYAHESYALSDRPITSLADIGGHRFIARVAETARSPADLWILDKVPAERVTFRTNDMHAADAAMMAGLGVLPLPAPTAQRRPGLCRISPPFAGWTAPLWLVTHVDQHRDPHIQLMLEELKRAFASMAGQTHD